MSGREWASCNCCGKYRPLSQTYLIRALADGRDRIKQFVCDECRGEEGEAEDEQLRYEYETGGKS
jgi:hypothetical protein